MHITTVRRALISDAAGIAEVHADSVRTLGSVAYAADIVAVWGAPRGAERYETAMRNGQAFFVAESPPGCLVGFSSNGHEKDGHHTAVYVRGEAARQGVGRALFAAAEAAARANGAREIVIESALGAVPFWTAMGFASEGEAEHRLRSGRAMRCVRMRKVLESI